MVQYYSGKATELQMIKVNERTLNKRKTDSPIAASHASANDLVVLSTILSTHYAFCDETARQLPNNPACDWPTSLRDGPNPTKSRPYTIFATVR